MSDRHHFSLTPFGGEFADPDREAIFQQERLPETVRHIRLLFLLSAILNALFLLSDWRFQGTTHFYPAVGSRLLVVVISLICLFASSRVKAFPYAQNVMLVWQWVTAPAIGVLVSSHSNLALFVVLLLPSIYYLAVPTSFKWSLLSGLACSATVLTGYILSSPAEDTQLGLALAIATLNIALILVVIRYNRLRRLEWGALLAERNTKNELIEAKALFETLFKTVPLPIVVVGLDGTIVDVNDTAMEYFGKSRDALGITNVAEIYAKPGDRQALLTELGTKKTVSEFETSIRLSDGSIRNVVLAATMVTAGARQLVMSALIDITERKAAEERIWRAASHDNLTGLPNRALFQSRFEQALAEARREHATVSLFLIDLDDFKSINDTLGHDAGDAFLREIALRLSTMLRPVDTVARLGGDEFVVIVGSSLVASNALVLARQLLAELCRPFAYGSHTIASSASIGIAVFPDHDALPSELLKDADLALYSAKALGRNQAAVYDPAMRNKLEQRKTLGRAIREAMQDGQIKAFYQPKVELSTGRIIGFEALARWEHPEQGLLFPSAFAAAFEDPEVAVALGEYMVRQAAQDIRCWLDEGLDCGRIAVNLSTAQFSWPGLVRRFIDIAQEVGIPPSRLDVEITETVFLGRTSAHVETALHQFHEHGLRIALDDFGTGYASLVHLKQFPVDDIKIDQSFIRDVDQDPENAAIVVAIIQLGQNLNKLVIAEGVESEGELDFLRRHGCSIVQGDYYSQAMPARAVPDYLALHERTPRTATRTA
jgi:diguanylate cyclase (GGDEF)-like protein/PAS domain S-box-containing protein